MPLDFSALIAELERDRSVNNSAKLLIERFAAEVEANKNDPVQLQTLVDEFRANNDDLATAVETRTPPVEG